MSIIGTPSQNFSQPIIDSQSLKDAYDLLFAAWETVLVPQNTPTKNLENSITWLFYSAITMEKARQTDSGERQYCFSFSSGADIVTQGRRTGIADIEIKFGNDERKRFTLEAKLLNKPKTSNAGAYVGTEGMGRFISGINYAVDLPEGGMMGYVLQDSIDSARQKVAEKIKEHSQTLGMSTGTLKASALRESVYETLHKKLNDQSPLTIYHIFLPVAYN